MKKLWLIPLVVLGIYLPVQAQTITSFYGTATAFVPNIYSDLTGYTFQWTGNNIGSDVETYCNPFIVRGFDKKCFQINYGGTDTCTGTVTFYGKSGSLSNWGTIYAKSITATGTAFIDIVENTTLMRIGATGSMTVGVEGDIYTKKR
jgi:hypothetical protein